MELQKILEHFFSNGLNPDQLILDGRLHKFKLDAKDAKKSAWFIGFQNYTRASGEPFYVVKYGNFRTGEIFQYQSDKKDFTKEDRAVIKEQMERARKKVEEDILRYQEEVAQEVQKKWSTLQDLVPDYFKSKGFIELYGCKSEAQPFNGSIAYMPLRDVDGKLWSLQKIYPDGTKNNKGKKRECFHQIGELSDAQPIRIVEGLATGITVHLATNEAVFVAVDSGNLSVVAEILRKKYNDRNFIICGDDDYLLAKNVGREKAEEAAKKSFGKAVFPVFKSLERGQFKEKFDKVPTDFDDLRILQGIEEVKNQISSVETTDIAESHGDAFIANYPYPDTTDKLMPLGTMRNLAELLKRLKIIVRYNVISKEEEILVPNCSFSVDNQGNAKIAYITDWCVRARIPTENIGQYITAIADANPYNPVITWIESKSWDGIPRLDNFYGTITAKGENEDSVVRELKKILMRNWMISCVAAAYEPNGISAGGVLVLQGDQYIGKTKWFKMLVPQHMNLTVDGAMLRPDDKDSVFHIISKWLVELGELDATFRKADIAQLKAFLTKDKDIIRRPYAKKESHYARRTIFFASVNETDFLRDETGNRRFWTIACEKIDYNHTLDMQQVWAEVKALYQSGQTWFLSPDEVVTLNYSNENFRPISPIEERVRTHYNWDDASRKECTATEVCQDIGIVNPSQHDTRSVTAALRKITGKDSRKSKYGRFFLVPNIINQK